MLDASCGVLSNLQEAVVSESLSQLSSLLESQAEDRLAALASFAQNSLGNGAGDDKAFTTALCQAVAQIVKNGEGSGPERVLFGEILGRLGDPRLLCPADASYWAPIQDEDIQIEVGRHPVTHSEFAAFVTSDAFQNDAHWTTDGLAWRDSNAKTWSFLATRVDPALVVPNQPVVGATWFEAMAYASSIGARLPTVSERLLIVRGIEKRPYPWGEPFGSNKANTREEALQRPCAVGLFRSDCTPDGVWDLAGNAGEWLADTVGEQRSYNPGSWKQDSLASWAKARALGNPEYRGDDLGFRLVRDR